jgi:hypothetical protein
VTAIGLISARRAYFTCAGCGTGEYAADRRIGLQGALSRQGRRVICWAGGRASFAEAAASLREIGGWTVSDETIRRACLAESKATAAWRAGSGRACEDFRAADGLAEFQSDAAKVNTDTGWRDVKIGIFAKRPPGEPATSEDFATRALPPPTARVAFVGLEPSEVFGARWRPWARRLGVDDPSALSVLGDGAEWIWNEATEQFPGAAQVLDVYHASEHLATASRAIHGEAAEATSWWRESRRRLVGDGWWGLCERIGAALVAEPTAACQAAMDGLTTYFSKHTGRMNYAHRLATGRSIGSGMVEGAAKLLIGRRLKQTGARWNVANVPAMGELCSITYSSCWLAYWDTA